MTGIQVRKQVQDTRTTPQGANESVYRIEFMVDDHGPFVETFTKAEYTPQVVNARLEEIARTARAIGK